LLEMDLSDGWEPLCKFLGMPVPNEPFPRANDAKAADDYATRLLLKVFGVWFGIFSAVGVTLYCRFWLWNNKDVLTYFLK
jgi:Sulfotransferase domain